MLSLLLALVIGDSTPAAAATPLATSSPRASYTAPPGWTSAESPPAAILAKFTRAEADGTLSIISLQRQACACTPETMADILQAAVIKLAGAHAQRSKDVTCGQPSETLLATGITNGTDRRNFLMNFFRESGLLYVQTYAFNSDSPKADAIAALKPLCPAIAST